MGRVGEVVMARRGGHVLHEHINLCHKIVVKGAPICDESCYGFARRDEEDEAGEIESREPSVPYRRGFR